jgi:hypothetical protein
VLRQFSAAWLVFFSVVGVQQYFRFGHQRLGAMVAALALVIGAIGLIRPPLVRWIFVGWMVLAFPIGWVISQLMLLLMYYLILTPVAIVFRVIGRDTLLRKRNKERASYWLPKGMPKDVRTYFRQY